MPNPIIAPYARAAALVDRDGTLVRAKNVTADVQKTDVGVYRVTVGENIDTTSAACQATVAGGSGAIWGAEIHVRTDPSNNDHIVTVFTGRNGAPFDQPFHLAVL
ncbi:hypothetical protein EKH77_26980 [Streptomyces luteoverticillatus]|uniref:Uncharacterized protein n=1 Tax=Streptomyces luteoverticillatus TaxID=66425 RepID=A0A3S9PPP0_STRLT|nr:hypothetical protein [Streptomyces luteoverticillatus]AZQ74369.1 hypothetical protein EKH77_26980 [Streptomyces luteoverticillatus]